MLTTWGFSRVTGKSRESSCAKLSRGASVPDVSKMLRTLSAHSAAIATPGSKHQYDSVGTSCPPARTTSDTVKAHIGIHGDCKQTSGAALSRHHHHGPILPIHLSMIHVCKSLCERQCVSHTFDRNILELCRADFMAV